MEKNQALANLVSTLFKEGKIKDIHLKKVLLSNLQGSNDVDTAILLLIQKLVNRGLVNIDFLERRFNLICAVNPEKFTSVKKVKEEYEKLERHNIKSESSPLDKNHKDIEEAFDNLNSLIDGKNYECYYTGSLPCYFNTNTPLLRYHDNIDLIIQQYDAIKLHDILVNSNFKMMIEKINNNQSLYLLHKNGTRVDLHLFEHSPNEGCIMFVDYYYDKNKKLRCAVNELNDDASYMIFDNKVRYHNRVPYKSVNLEYIYANKVISNLPKDRFDNDIIKDFIDTKDVENIEFELRDNMEGSYSVEQDPLKSIKSKR